MKVFAPWMGLMGWAAITELTRCQNTKPVFFLLDEATNFRIENLSNSLTGLREFGIRVWFVIQELEEYASVYGRKVWKPYCLKPK
jgi:type IV secretion system protein VirD4